MRRTPFRRKILLYSSALLIALIVAMLGLVDYRAERFVGERLETDIKQGRERIVAEELRRNEELLLTSRFVASFPELKALISETSSETVRDYLVVYQTRNRKGETVLIIAAPDGTVIARTDKSQPAAIPQLVPILQGMSGEPVTAVIGFDRGVYHIAVAPLEAAGNLYGYAAAAAPINSAYASRLRDLVSDDIVIVADSVLGSSVSEATLPWHTRAEWENVVPPDSGIKRFDVQGENYHGVATTLGSNGALRPLAIIMQSHDDAIAPYREIQAGLLLVGLAAAALGIAGSYVFARNVTAPVAKLVEGTHQVAAGNFDYRLDVNSGDEIGDLARSFNVMTQGLRERADMQKFVSQSTVDMIQSSSQKKVSAGEKTTLTIMFSDMRGFTGMTQYWSPEQTIRMLNSCLSLQADRVKKFHGDIDKYVGDCVVALFRGDDMELNAIRCAVEIHRALDAFNASKPNEPPLRVGIGIVTGEVILGSIGSEDRLDFTVIGSNVNLCSRLCSHAGARETLLGESTYVRVEGLVAAEKLEPLQVKGFTEPVPVYRMSTASRISV
jgi:class 3 adenylate cyclase